MKKWEIQKTFDMPIQVNKEVRNYIYYFSTDKKDVFNRYLSRSTRYLPMIKEVFQEAGLPEDLAYLAMIESGFNNKAYSPAAACGMWQFIKGTGLRYGLTIDSYVDERRDPEKATRAAAKYLLDLYKQFGSWYLAAASYNCGEGRVQRELNQSNHKNFWELSANMCLPTETKNYVPQMIAATIIAKNPEKFGFKNVPYLPPMKYEAVKLTEATSLQAAAVAATTDHEEISALNPELLRDSTPGGAYLLKIPPARRKPLVKTSWWQDRVPGLGRPGLCFPGRYRRCARITRPPGAAPNRTGNMPALEPMPLLGPHTRAAAEKPPKPNLGPNRNYGFEPPRLTMISPISATLKIKSIRKM